MQIINSRRRYFDKPDGNRNFVGRRVKYEANGTEKEIFITPTDLPEVIEYNELENFLVAKEGE